MTTEKAHIHLNETLENEINLKVSSTGSAVTVTLGTASITEVCGDNYDAILLGDEITANIKAYNELYLIGTVGKVVTINLEPNTSNIEEKFRQYVNMLGYTLAY